jgi:hypothetical protein
MGFQFVQISQGLSLYNLYRFHMDFHCTVCTDLDFHCTVCTDFTWAFTVLSVQISHRFSPSTVYRSPRATTVMVAATHICPAGWTTEYSGHLMSGYGAYSASMDYICVDANPQARPGGQGNAVYGGRLYYTISKCGSLPCPPFQQDKILSCAVCSK